VSPCVRNIWDAGLFLGAKVGDKVWLDTNGNGRQDAGEPGKAGVDIKLKLAGPDGNVAADDAIVAQTGTNASGVYSVVGIDNGTYYIEFSRPTGFVFTLRNQGDDLDDSDAGRSSSRSPQFTIVNYAGNLSIYAGLVQAVSVSGHVGVDNNGDGTIDPGPGRSGVSVVESLVSFRGHLGGYLKMAHTVNWLCKHRAKGTLCRQAGSLSHSNSTVLSLAVIKH